MEERVLKVHCVKAGGNAGKNARSYRIPLPNTWANQMGVTPDDREVKVQFDGSVITIEKLEKTE